MENQVNVGDRNIQQIGLNPVNQPVLIPEKPRVNYWMISALLCIVLLVCGLLYFNFGSFKNNFNYQQSTSSSDTVPKTSEFTLSPTNLPVKENEIENQKYGYLTDLSIKPDKWSYDRIVKNPSLSEAEKNEIDNYFASNLKNLFETKDNKSKNFINNFTVRSFLLRPIYSGRMSPPDRANLESINLVINYEFQFDWFKTTYFQFPDKNTGSITMDLILFDYKNNKFVKRETILSSDTSKYLAFKNGLEKIISFDEAKKLIINKMIEKGKNVEDGSIDYEQYITVANDKMRLFVESSNITKLCVGQEKDPNTIKRVNATNCNIDLLSSETQCEVKETYCASRL